MTNMRKSINIRVRNSNKAFLLSWLGICFKGFCFFPFLLPFGYNIKEVNHSLTDERSGYLNIVTFLFSVYSPYSMRRSVTEYLFHECMCLSIISIRDTAALFTTNSSPSVLHIVAQTE